MSKFRNTGVVWCPSIPSNWMMSRVKNYFEISKEVADDKNPIILRLARSGIQIRDISTNEGQIAESYEKYNSVQPGDLLLNPMDLYSGANCNVSEISGVISPAYINLRPKVSVNPEYFDYYFKLQYWTMAMFAHGKGVSFDNRWTINTEGIKNYDIPIPPLSIQNDIVNAISHDCFKIDLLIANQQKQIKKLKEYRISVINNTVTKGMNVSTKMKENGVGIVGQLPDNWKISRIKYLFTSSKGLSITKEDLIDNGLAVISYGQIHSKCNKGVEVKNELIRYVSFDKQRSNENCKVDKYDFIFADTSEDYEGCGNCVYKNDDSLLFAGYHTIVLHSKYKNNNKYFAYLFQSDVWRKQLRQSSFGVKVFSITQRNLMNAHLIIPPKVEKKRIVEYLDEKCSGIDKLILIKEKKIEQLEQYKKSLIYEYVIGKKEV